MVTTGYRVAMALFTIVMTVTASSPLKITKPKRACHLSVQPSSQQLVLSSSVALSVRGGSIGSRFDKFIDKLFDEADTNHNGSISTAEVFELVLFMCIKLNRQAPIPPPTKQTVNALFSNADVDGNKRLSREEFKRLMLVFYKRASARLILHKIVKLLVAPILALKVVSMLTGKQYLIDLAETFPEKVAHVLENKDLWKTVLTVLFVVTLGNIVLSMASIVLDSIYLKKKEKKERRFF